MPKLLRYLTTLLTLLLLLGRAAPACAELDLEISGADEQPLPVAILAFAGEKTALGDKSISGVIQADLSRTGLFNLVDTSFVKDPISDPNQLNFGDWQARGVQSIVLGSIDVAANNQLTVRFRLMNATLQIQDLAYSFPFTVKSYRDVAHQISDLIYQKLIGEPGIFSTHIAYIVKEGKRFELQVADADGQNAETLFSSQQPLMTPRWSFDGKKLAYVSFEKGKPVVVVQDFYTQARQVVAAFKGNNSAPAWSPDGKTLAIVLTQDGLSQIYVINSSGGTPTRLMTSFGIDTEPVYSSDGAWIYFTSDRGGSPQIYKVPSQGGEAQRVTFEGSYNVTPRLSPDGRSLAMIRGIDGHFRVTLQDLDSGVATPLTDSDEDESPSFSPNGRMILYATRLAGQGVLAAVSTNGRVRNRLSVKTGDVREPAWGPLLKTRQGE